MKTTKNSVIFLHIAGSCRGPTKFFQIRRKELGEGAADQWFLLLGDTREQTSVIMEYTLIFL